LEGAYKASRADSAGCGDNPVYSTQELRRLNDHALNMCPALYDPLNCLRLFRPLPKVKLV
jgi:hypothetical protein